MSRYQGSYAPLLAASTVIVGKRNLSVTLAATTTFEDLFLSQVLHAAKSEFLLRICVVCSSAVVCALLAWVQFRYKKYANKVQEAIADVQ